MYFDGSHSISWLEIMNFTWTIDPIGAVLYGVNVSYTFEEQGEYTVTLTVMDAFGQIGSHSFKVTVVIPPPVKFTLHIGPILDEDGEPVNDAEVTLDFGVATFVNSTDVEGTTSFILDESYLGSGVNVTIEKTDYEAIILDTFITDSGEVDASIPRMKLIEKEKADKEFPVFALVLMILFILLILIAVTIYVIRRKQKTEGLEE